MAEIQPTKSPKSLYKLALKTYTCNLNNNVTTLDKYGILRGLPPTVLADIYTRMAAVEELREFLCTELTDIDIFSKILKFGEARQKIFRCFSSMMANNRQVAQGLVNTYIQRTHDIIADQKSFSCIDQLITIIDCGLRIGSFLAEAGWLEYSIHILSATLRIINLNNQDYDTMLIKLDCLQRLLHAQAGFCCFKEADRSFKNAQELINLVGVERIPPSLLANYYIKVSVLNFTKSDYDHSYKWSVKALHHLNQKTPDKITIDVLRQAAKSCVLKRHFQKAHILLVQALKMAKNTFGRRHQKYSDALMDYGFFLLNVDSIVHSVNVYEDALDIKRHIFGNRNLHVAIAEEDLSYALYVCEYSSGRFDSAQDHVEKAIQILLNLVPSNHLMLASARRVKALILEEIALDHSTPETTENNALLIQSEGLHQSALQLSLEAFGEVNVQTAKHYGNLGRLYQSMTKYSQAEKMHQRAIKIKTDILGAYDYEVGLSIGHLASLYNYHMNKHREAEKLYLRSISISLKLFGESYSGLEYDYRGLCHVYESLEEIDKYLEYHEILETWKVLREGREEESKTLYEFREESSLEEVTQKFFEMCSDPNALSVRS